MNVTPEGLHEAAYKHIKDRRDFWPHLIAHSRGSESAVRILSPQPIRMYEFG